MDDPSLGKPGLAQVVLQSIEKERLAREQREAKGRRDAIREFAVHFQSVAFGKAAAYVTPVAGAGYVASSLWGIWRWDVEKGGGSA